MSCELVHRIDAFSDAHVNLLSSRSVRLLDDFVEHPLQRLIAALNSPDVFRTFKCCWIEYNSFLRQCPHEHSSVVHPSITSNKLWPTVWSDPSFDEPVKTV